MWNLENLETLNFQNNQLCPHKQDNVEDLLAFNPFGVRVMENRKKWRDWSKVCMSTTEDGLGVRDFAAVQRLSK